ncbi:hypothetical protein BF29_1120 [Heyndrickxia coagulans DSM 1 = ATCC 7050]|nr:hypothetical protein BF29_1120 [Heyndrickxia coagulans DSM 1 = ATCC 7050]
MILANSCLFLFLSPFAVKKPAAEDFSTNMKNLRQYFV